ncbi:MAG: ImmA/IrrE family metallo-endopeptidase, partial [Actinomycetota bacterium]|nr:ImmA/IrrE family metallo-endopeptidase [Actinomycetota bacterium]
MSSPTSPATIIAALLGQSDGLEAELAEALDLPDGVLLDDVLSGAHLLTPSDLIAASDVLGVPVTVLTGDVPMDRHLGVSLRMGRVSGAADVPLDALTYADTVLGHQAVLDSWLGPVVSPLAGVAMHTDKYRIAAGTQSADRVRRVLGLGSGPVVDLVGLIERLGYPVLFRELPEALHGLNVRDERGGTVARVIVVSTRGGWPMQRYTLAHELCHALYDDPGQVIVDRVEVPDMLTER